MNSKTNWLIKVGTAGLMLAFSGAPLTAQRIEIPYAGFAFTSEQRDAARGLHNEGVNLYENGKYGDAEKKFREVVQKFKNGGNADRSDYYLIRTLIKLNKVQDAISEMNAFEKEFPKSVWLKDVREEQIRLTKEIPAGMTFTIVPAPPAPPQPPQPPQAPMQPPQPPTRGGRLPGMGVGIGGVARAPRADENPEVSLQREVLRVLFDNSPDRALEIAADRLKADPADPVVLSSLYMVAQSRSDKALPLLVTLARTSTDSRMRREALNWIGRARGDKDAIADILVGLVPFMNSDEDAGVLAFALGQLNNAKTFDALASMARDKNKSDRLRLNAIQAIGDSRLANRVALLDEIYKANMDNSRIRRQVVNFITHGKDPQVVDILARIAQNDPDIAVRRDAVNFLGQVKTPEAMKALESLLTKKP